MLAPRIGESIQPAWDRTTAVVAVKLQPALEHTAVLTRGVASMVAFALRPAALVATACGLWRLGIDLGWTQDFFVASGFFSHWQVWFALAAAMVVSARFLSRKLAGLHDGAEED